MTKSTIKRDKPDYIFVTSSIKKKKINKQDNSSCFKMLFFTLWWLNVSVNPRITCAELWVLVHMDHGSSSTRCTPIQKSTDKRLPHVTLDHKTSPKLHGYICRNIKKIHCMAQNYRFNCMPKIIRILSKDIL